MPAPVAPASLPLPHSPSTHYPPINGPGEWGWGPVGTAQEGAGMLGGPPGTKVPSWLPGCRRWAQLKGGGSRRLICLPERGVPMVPRLSYPLGRCLRFGTEPWREEGEHTPPPWATHDPAIPGPWSRVLRAACLACSHPSVLACGVRVHGLSRPTGPSVSSGPLLLFPSPGAFLPEAGRGLRGAPVPPTPALRSGEHLEATLTAPHVPVSVPDGPIC